MIRLARVARSATREEGGFAIVAAIAILAVVLLLGAAAVTATVSSVSIATHGTNDAKALQAADDAAETGWNRINLVKLDSLGLSVTTPCLSWPVTGNITAVAALVFGTTSWCPSVTVPVPGASSASYQVSQLTTGARYLVGTATVGNVTRRVELVLNQSSTSSPLFSGYALESQTDLDFVNQTLVKFAGVRTDGSIKLEDTAVPCHVPNGSITPGVGKTVTTTNNAGKCGQDTTPEQTTITFPPITVPPVASTDDSRICVATQDPCVGTTNGLTWDSAHQALTLQNTGNTVTLTGNTYVFCNLTLNNGTLFVNPRNGLPVSIYFQTPAACAAEGFTVGAQDLTVQNNTAWIDNQVSSTLGAQGLQIYIAGAETVYLNNSSSTVINGTIYAPTGTVNMINSALVKGAVAAHTVTLTASAEIDYDTHAGSVNGAGGGILYKGHQYLECPAQPASGQAPDNGCP